MSEVKIGIIGLGFMGATHLRALHEVRDCELGAVSATNAKALAGDLSAAGGNLGAVAGRFDFSGVHRYENWRDLIADREVAAVDICLPTDLHAEVAIAALSSGKHVLCEKPMALDDASCQQMLDAAAANGRVLMIGHVLRFWPEYEALQRFVCERGEAVRTLEFKRSCGLPDWSRWLPREERSGGAILDLLIHDIDQAIWLWGMPESVEANREGREDTLAARLHYSKGRQVLIEGGWFPAGAPFSMGFAAHVQSATLCYSSNRLVLRDETGERPYPSTTSDAYRAELAYFAECCRSGKQPVRCPPEQSAQAVGLARLLKRSREGGPIQCSD